MESEGKSILTKKVFPSRFYDTFFVSEYGRLESLRASRYNTNFSIVLMHVEGFGEKINMREGSEALEFFKKLVATVLDSVRNCDIVGLLEDRQIIAILPETDYFGSLITIRKISRAAALLKKSRPSISIIFSQATFPRDGRGYGELLGTAVKRVSEKKESLWEKLDLKGKLFWEIISDLSGKPFNGIDNASFETGGSQELSEFFIDQINELTIKEVSRTPQKRGILYFSSRKITPGLPLIKNLGLAGVLATKVFLVGEGDNALWDIKNATPILLDDPRLRETFFTFFLNEDSGYGLISKENWGATYSCFHTADPYLVEGLITKFQSEYSLQEQLG